MTDKTNELIQRAAQDIVESEYAIALTGAGISTESGIPDFRGPSGVWTKDPEAEKQAYVVYEQFVENPKKWWQDRLAGSEDPLAHWRNMESNLGHLALTELEKMDILKCTITQNVDGLHEKSGAENVYNYHGTTAKLRCISCHKRYRIDDFNFESLKANNQLPPRCKACGDPLKSDVVFFGEPIPPDVAQQSEVEAGKCDLMLICGTSAVVYPFAGLPLTARYGSQSRLLGFLVTKDTPTQVKIIEVNAEPTPLTEQGVSDYLIQGKTGQILPQIVEVVKRLR
ncbi:MAG: RNA polymerase subunit sigma [Proteobacteria bacterium]|nr:RNA polymerase subunit sigma [Pseudomonadota bacterium]